MQKAPATDWNGKGGAKAVVGLAPAAVPYRKLLHFGLFVVRGASYSFIASTVVGIAAQFVMLFKAKLLGSVVEQLQTGAASDATTPLALLGLLTVLGIGLAYAERIVTTWSDLRMLARLQQTLHDRLLTLGPSYHSRHGVAENTAVVTQFATGAQLILRDLIGFPIVRGVSLVGALVVLYGSVSRLGAVPLSLKLTLLAALVAMPLVSVRIAQRLRAAFTKARKSDLAVAEELQNSFAQPLEVQLMGAGAQRSSAVGARLAEHYANRFRAASRTEFATQFQSAVPTLLQLGFLAYGFLVATRNGDAAAGGAVVAIYALVPLAIQPLQQLVQFYNGLNSAWPQVEKVVEILETRPEVADAEHPAPFPAGPCDVSLTDVTVRYGEGAPPVLRSLTCRFESGGIAALVGASGSGKSTLFNLIARLTDPESGRVEVGGADLRSLSLADVRRRIVRVAQFPLFISGTVRENFRLSKVDASDTDIEAVCRSTGLWDVLVRVSAGAPLEYVLPRDVSQGLSGGQRRLLAISRALLHRPAVLLLDEPTTGIDNVMLGSLTTSLKSLSREMTILVIDHDIGGFVARIADSICVLEGGRVSDRGTHDELMARGGLYRRLVEAGDAPPTPAAPAPAPAPMDANMKKSVTFP